MGLKLIQFTIYPLSLLVLTPVGRFIFVVLGAVIVLGPSDINFAKVYYLVVLLLCSLHDSISILKTSNAQTQRRFLLLILTTICLMVSNFIGASKNDLPLTDYLRGNIQVIIFLLGLPLVFNCGKLISHETVKILVVTFGLIAAFSVWFYWSQKHGSNNFATERFALDADYLAFLGYCTVLCCNFKNHFYKMLNLLALILIPIFLFLSLSRTNYVFVLWILGWSIITNRAKFKWFTFSVFLLISSIFSGLLQNIIGKLENNPAINVRFLQTFSNFDLNSYINSDMKTDASLIMRQEQSETALQIFQENIFFGQGSLAVGEYIDHFYGAFAILGILGFSIFFILLFQICSKSNLQRLLKEEFRLIILFVSTFVPATFIYNWSSNKGLWLSLLCVLAIQESHRFKK